jgi:PAS domain S-box-containing protein
MMRFYVKLAHESSSPQPPLPAPPRQAAVARYGAAAAGVVAATMLAVWIGPRAGGLPAIALFAIPILWTTWTHGSGPGVFAAAASVVAARFVASRQSDAGPAAIAVIAAFWTMIVILATAARRGRRVEEQHAYLAAVVASSDDAIVTKDLNGVIRSWNAGAERLFGYTAAEAVGRAITMLMTPDRYPEETDILARIARGEHVEHFETVGRAKDGRRLDISVTLSPVRGPSGSIIGASKIARDIGERRRAEEARARLAAIVESSDDAIISKDLNGIIQSANGGAERVFGYSAAELVGRPVTVLIPEERQAEETDILGRLRRGERVEHFETVRVRRDGRRIDVSLTVSPVRDSSGAIIGASKIARDITDNKRAAEALATHREWLRVTLSSIGDAVIAADPTGQITFLNPVAEGLTGWSSQEAVGQPLSLVFRIINEKTREPAENVADKVIRSGHVVGLANHTVLIARDGTEIPIADSAAPILAENGSIQGVVLVFHDVTEARRAEEALAEQKEWLETTLESIGDAVIATDPRGNVVFMNPIAEHLTGRRAAEALGLPCDDVFRIANESTRLPAVNPVSRVLAEGAVVGLANHTVLISADGTERPIDDSGAPIRNRDGRIVGVVLVFRDVSERRRVAIERERLLDMERAARAAAEHANRVKDDFVAMVSHELRTPLNAILGWTHILAGRPDDAASVRRGLQVIERNTQIQVQLISDLLDISRIVSGKLRLDIENLDLRRVVNDAVQSLQPVAEAKRLTLLNEVAADAIDVTGDPARLQQCVWNLLSNAIKFTPAGGRIVVAVRRASSHAELSVTDSGVGIQPEILPYIFDRFQQGEAATTRRFGGLGLGLTIVKQIVELHGGNIRAESAGEGKGARFTVSLPMNGATARPNLRSHIGPSGAGDGADSTRLDRLRVLLVEDDNDTREVVEMTLRERGAEVVCAGSVDEALTIFRAGPPDVLVSDIGLPGADGYDLIRQVRQMAPARGGSIPAIALTAFVRSSDRTRALLAGFQMHVGKPIEPAELVMSIAALTRLAGGRPPESLPT